MEQINEDNYIPDASTQNADSIASAVFTLGIIQSHAAFLSDSELQNHIYEFNLDMSSTDQAFRKNKRDLSIHLGDIAFSKCMKTKASSILHASLSSAFPNIKRPNIGANALFSSVMGEAFEACESPNHRQLIAVYSILNQVLQSL